MPSSYHVREMTRQMDRQTILQSSLHDRRTFFLAVYGSDSSRVRTLLGAVETLDCVVED